MIVKKNSAIIKKVDGPTPAQIKKEKIASRPKWEWKKNKNGKVLLVPRGKDAYDLPDNWTAFEQDVVLFSMIASEVANGSSFHKLEKKPGFPTAYLMYKWYYENEDFRTMINLAKKERADLYHDKLSDVADKVKEYNSKSSKVKADVYKHLMAVGDPDQYGSKTKISGDSDNPVTFVVDTGIRRLEKNPPISVEGKVVDEQAQSTDNIDGVLPAPTSDGNTLEPEEV